MSDLADAVAASRGLLRYLTCPYFAGTGERQCVSGCRDEPECMTLGPWNDEVVGILRWVADLPVEDDGRLDEIGAERAD